MKQEILITVLAILAFSARVLSDKNNPVCPGGCVGKCGTGKNKVDGFCATGGICLCMVSREAHDLLHRMLQRNLDEQHRLAQRRDSSVH